MAFKVKVKRERKYRVSLLVFSPSFNMTDSINRLERILPLPYLPTYIARLVFDRLNEMMNIDLEFLVVRRRFSRMMRQSIVTFQSLQTIGQKHRIIMQRNIEVFMTHLISILK